MRRMVLLIAVLALSLVPVPVAAAPSSSGNFPARIELPPGFFPEGIESGRGTSFFVGSLANGAIRRGDFRTGSTAPLVGGADGRAAVGIAYEESRNRLWVAGGGPNFLGIGDVRAYDASTGALLAAYPAPSVGFLNDVAITRDAVYVTDSFNPWLVVIPLSAGGSLPAAPDVLPLSGDYTQQPGTFGLNGIVAKGGWLVAVRSLTGELFRIDPDTGEARVIDLGGATVTNGDGLELVGHTLYVVRNTNEVVTVVRLGPQLTTGVVLGDITSPDLDVPTTGTVAAGRLWVVNARFGTAEPSPTTEYWITQLPRRP